MTDKNINYTAYVCIHDSMFMYCTVHSVVMSYKACCTTHGRELREGTGLEGNKEIVQCKQIQQYTTHGSLRNDAVVNGYI
jgi:hypothetical protein